MAAAVAESGSNEPTDKCPLSSLPMPPPALVDSLPVYVSLEEHINLISSTPTSFNEIPPVLRHREDNVSITLDPPLEGFSSAECVSGTLYIIEKFATP